MIPIIIISRGRLPRLHLRKAVRRQPLHNFIQAGPPAVRVEQKVERDYSLWIRFEPVSRVVYRRPTYQIMAESYS